MIPKLEVTNNYTKMCNFWPCICSLTNAYVWMIIIYKDIKTYVAMQFMISF